MANFNFHFFCTEKCKNTSQCFEKFCQDLLAESNTDFALNANILTFPLILLVSGGWSCR
jgi:hypothetical protein